MVKQQQIKLFLELFLFCTFLRQSAGMFNLLKLITLGKKVEVTLQGLACNKFSSFVFHMQMICWQNSRKLWHTLIKTWRKGDIHVLHTNLTVYKKVHTV
jgi:hypothetical protein